MRKTFLALTLAGTVLVLVSGCGGGDSKVDPNNVTINYKTSGTYDLSQYIVPAQNQVNNYVDKTYTNNKGEKKYSKTPDEETFSASRFEVSLPSVTEYVNDHLDTTYTISNDRINAVDAEDNETDAIARYADKGNYILKSIKTVKNDNEIPTQVKLVCKVNKSIASKEINNKTYNDIIEVTCSSTSTASSTFNGQTFSYSDNGTSVIYYAKGIGEISSIDEDCSTTTVAKAISKECTKETEDITTIN